MKRSLVAAHWALGIGLLIAAPAAAQDRDGDDWCEGAWRSDDAQVCEERESTLRADGEVIRVDAGPNGGASFEGWDRNEIRVTARVSATADDEERAREILREIRVVTDGGTIRAEGPKIRGRRNHEHWSVSFRVMVPARSDIDAHSVNGGIAATGVSGRMDLRTTNGGVRLNRVSGEVRARTTNGGVKIALDGDRWRGVGLDAQTTNGGVVLEIPSGYNADLAVATTNGGLDIDFPITLQGRIGGRNARLETQLGSGGPEIRAETTNGGVVVRRI